EILEAAARLGRILADISDAHYCLAEHELAFEAGQRALALATELEMRPLQAHRHRSLGKLHHQLGRHDEAREEFSTGITMLREMGMTFWLPEAMVELAQVQVAPTVG
ncbi:MAG: tetratricopeptide repeat protein, partial [Chloroflexi bacterium]|nr:tetratricopeptide repeat protein [Chloroflexota bacterium]